MNEIFSLPMRRNTPINYVVGLGYFATLQAAVALTVQGIRVRGKP